MTGFELSSQPWVTRLGWTLLHFPWQGTLIAVALAAVRAVFGRALSARARYGLACVALGVMTVAPALTYIALVRIGPQAPPLVWAFAAPDWQRALPWLVTAWMVGLIGFSIRLIGGWRVASRLRSVSVRPVPSEWERTFERLLHRMGAARPVRLLTSTLVETPTVVGWLRPVVLMPIGALTGLPPEHVTALLAHELAHICRNDYLANMLQSFAEAVLFYHPAVWWVSDQIRTEREACCDDLAVVATGGDVLTYARALAEIEGCRPAHLKTALAANGASLIARIRRLLGQAPSVSQTLPSPAEIVSLGLLWIVGIGAVALQGSHTPVDLANVLASQPLGPKQSLLSALLFDPFFQPPQAAAPPVPQGPPVAPPVPITVQPPIASPVVSAALQNQHGHTIGSQRTYLIEAGEQAVMVPAGTRAKLEAELGKEAALLFDQRMGGPQVTPDSSLGSVAFETWVEDSSSDYVEVSSSGSAGVDKGDGKITIHRYVRDERRHVYVRYAAMIETLPEPGAYRLTLGDSSAEEQIPGRTSTYLPVVALEGYPVPQIVRDGEAVRLGLYVDPRTGQKVVEYIEVGPYNRITPRKEAPHDSYASDAEFNLTQPHLKVNGVTLEAGALPETLRGPEAWLYVPGYGRYILSFKSYADHGADNFGEVNGNTLILTDGGNIFRVECSERIAGGSGSYRVHFRRDESWAPADPNDRALALIGAGPAN